ncbi:MAG: DUF6318 family protein [Jatrophihabitantaceae bacterium]
MGRRVVLAGFAAVVVMVAGCTGGSAGPNRSTASVGTATSGVATTSLVPTPTPTPTSPYPADVPLTGHNVKPGEKPPTYPDAAKARSQAGANAFAEFFMRTLDWAYATTNPSYMKHYYAPSCGQCSGLASGISKTATDHHWYMGGRLTVHDATGTARGSVTADADYCFQLVIDITATSVVDKNGHILNGDGAYSGNRFKLCAAWTQITSWQVSFLARQS